MSIKSVSLNLVMHQNHKSCVKTILVSRNITPSLKKRCTTKEPKSHAITPTQLAFSQDRSSEKMYGKMTTQAL
jgi:hypothetical protein